VIIAAYRARATLPLVLGALESHVVGKDREVVLVESAGANGLRLEQQWPWVRVVSFAQRVFPGRARNIGAAVAHGDLLAFLDADTIPEDGWLDELERALTPGVEMVAGAILDGTPDSPWGTVAYALEFLEWVPERGIPLGHAAGCNLLMHRAMFERSGGFPEDLYPGEDTVFTAPFAANRTLAFAPRAQVRHLNRVGRREVLAHQQRLGASWVEVCRRVSLPGRRLAVPSLAPMAVLGRLWALVKQLRRSPGASRRTARHGPRLAAGLVAWGVGVWRAGDVDPPGGLIVLHGRDGPREG
jgi:glycosyltransferase involved in cell wall biosynthesis